MHGLQIKHPAIQSVLCTHASSTDLFSVQLFDQTDDHLSMILLIKVNYLYSLFEYNNKPNNQNQTTESKSDFKIRLLCDKVIYSQILRTTISKNIVDTV